MKNKEEKITNKREFWKWLLYSLLGIYLAGIGYGFITSVDNEVQLNSNDKKLDKLESVCETISKNNDKCK